MGAQNRESAIRTLYGLRQWPTLRRILGTVRISPDILGLILIGSLAGELGDALSDIDLMVVAHPGRFVPAWDRRRDLCGAKAPLAAWEVLKDDHPECAGFVWLDADLVLVEALICIPGRARLAADAPVLQLYGPSGLLDRFARRPRVHRSEFVFNHRVEIALKELQRAVRVDTSDRPRPWEESGGRPLVDRVGGPRG